MSLHEKRALRARVGMHLTGPMPTIAQLMHKFRLGRSAACNWHVRLTRARREFAA